MEISTKKNMKSVIKFKKILEIFLCRPVLFFQMLIRLAVNVRFLFALTPEKRSPPSDVVRFRYRQQILFSETDFKLYWLHFYLWNINPLSDFFLTQILLSRTHPFLIVVKTKIQYESTYGIQIDTQTFARLKIFFHFSYPIKWKVLKWVKFSSITSLTFLDEFGSQNYEKYISGHSMYLNTGWQDIILQTWYVGQQ